MTRTSARLALALGTATLLLSACGSGSTTAGTSSSPSGSVAATTSASGTVPSDPMKAAFTREFLRGINASSTGIGFDQASANCVADKFIDTVGAAKVAQYGLANGNTGSFDKKPLSVADATTLADAVINCAPNDGAIRYFESKFDQGLGTAADATQKACLHAAIGRQEWVNILISEYDGTAAAATADLRTKVQEIGRASCRERV